MSAPNWRHAHERMYQSILDDLIATGWERSVAEKIARMKATRSSERCINKFERTRKAVEAFHPDWDDDQIQKETVRLEKLAASYVGKNALGKGRRIKHIRTLVDGVEVARVGERGV